MKDVIQKETDKRLYRLKELAKLADELEMKLDKLLRVIKS